MHWLPLSPADDHPPRRNRAFEAVAVRARAISVAFAPSEHELLKIELAAAMGAFWLDDTGQLRVRAADITVLVSDSEQRHLERVAELRRNAEIWALSTEQERKVRTYLQEDALATTANAVAWWLAKEPSNIKQCADLIDVLDRLSNTTSGRSTLGLTELQRNETEDQLDGAKSGKVADALLDQFEETERRFFASQLADVIGNAGRVDLADTIRQRYDVEPIAPQPIVRDDQPSSDLSASASPVPPPDPSEALHEPEPASTFELERRHSQP